QWPTDRGGTFEGLQVDDCVRAARQQLRGTRDCDGHRSHPLPGRPGTRASHVAVPSCCFGRGRSQYSQFVVLVGGGGAAYPDRSGDLPAVHDGHASLQRDRPCQVQRGGPSVRGLVLELLARPAATAPLPPGAGSGRHGCMSSPPASTTATTGHTPRAVATAAAASAAIRAPSCVSAGTLAAWRVARAPARDTDSSWSGVSPLVPMAPITSPSARSGMPPVSAAAPCSASAPSRPALTCSSISRLGRTKMAAVRALSIATWPLAACAPSVRVRCSTCPHASTTAITTRCPYRIASAFAAAVTASGPAVLSALFMRTAVMAVTTFPERGHAAGPGPRRC